MITHSPEEDKYKEETNKEMEMCLKNMSKTLDSTSEGIIVNPNTEESGKEIENREDQNAWLSEKEGTRRRPKP